MKSSSKTIYIMIIHRFFIVSKFNEKLIGEYEKRSTNVFSSPISKEEDENVRNIIDTSLPSIFTFLPYYYRLLSLDLDSPLLSLLPLSSLLLLLLRVEVLFTLSPPPLPR